MNGSILRRRWRRLFNRVRFKVADPYVKPQVQFLSLVGRERALADRNGHTFSLLVFTLNKSMNKSDVRDLIDTIHKRTRETDDVGWLDSDLLGVLLPYTAHDGAEHVARDIQQHYSDQNTRPHCTVYVYPPEKPDTNPAGRNHNGDSLNYVLTPARPPYQRGIDIAGSMLALMVFSPIMMAAAMAIKLTSQGPVFFSQKRAGRGGKPFNFYKFRTMLTNAEDLKQDLMKFNEAQGPVFKIKDDPRITYVGRFLRKTSIDELPQLWNVLKGDMSLVGPRPLPVEEAQACAGWQHRRLEVSPGLTCIWQVSGRCDVDFNEWVRMDIKYAQNQSLSGDLKILCRTIPAVLSQKGAY